MDQPDNILELFAGGSEPADAVRAPWTPEQVYRLNRRQDDERVGSYRCPFDQTDLYATRGGWICPQPNHRCGFRQTWARDRHINHPFIPPGKDET